MIKAAASAPHQFHTARLTDFTRGIHPLLLQAQFGLQGDESFQYADSAICELCSCFCGQFAPSQRLNNNSRRFHNKL
ncbi:hypothetical protein BsWGS_14466 [Bradybaena similaris]